MARPTALRHDRPVDPVLREALEPVLHDLARAGLEPPEFDSTDWAGDSDRASVMMWRADGSGAGVSVARAAPLVERVVEAADQVQEWAIEGQLWGRAPTNWPSCPRHPSTHPLEPVVVTAEAVWVCPRDRSVVALIGGA